MLLKRFFCGLIALVLLACGGMLLNSPSLSKIVISGIFLVGGATLGHVSIRQTMPGYSFWITLVAIALAYALFSSKINTNVVEEATDDSIRPSHQQDFQNKQKSEPKVLSQKMKRKRKATGFNLSAYPRVSGSATVIHAHVFYVGGRYVRLFGVDAPDNDQICSSATGSSYNCGEEAASWMRSWIDKNQIDCYLLKVDPQGQDLATCVWGEYDIGAGLVGSGWGIANTRETHIYEPYQAKAQSLSSGLWQGSFYNPEDWRDIKRSRNNFKIQRRRSSKNGGFFNFGSWFK